MRLGQLQTFILIAAFDLKFAYLGIVAQNSLSLSDKELKAALPYLKTNLILLAYCAAANFAKDSATATDNSEV